MRTQNFGELSYADGALLEFPAGLPGFEARRRFLPVTIPASEPLVFLQSEEDAGLCFITLPVRSVDPDYRLLISQEDRALIGLDGAGPLEPGPALLCLAVVALAEDGPTANLLAPIVVNMSNRKAVQAIGPGSEYSCRHALLPVEEAAAC
jgi:flagellar assembly factor FliW